MNKEYKLKDFPSHCKLSTRFIDMDAFQHINNAAYASYIETARVEMFKNWKIEGSNSGKSIIMASLKINYLKQLKHPSDMIIAQRISRIGKTSFDIESVVFNEELVAICHTLVVAVCFDFEKQVPVDVYDAIKNDYTR